MAIFKEFKEFAMKGNLVDMAVAFVMGAAFTKLVSGFIDGIVMPVVGRVTAGVDFNTLVLPMGNASIKYGQFITISIDFVLVAFVMFMLVKLINRARKKQETVAVPPPAPTKEELLLEEIRNLLRDRPLK